MVRVLILPTAFYYDGQMRLFYLLVLAAFAAQASVVVFHPAPGTGPAVPVTVTISDTATGVSIQTAVTGQPTGDLRGLFFNLSGALPACGQISGWSACQVAEGAVIDLGNGANMHGVGSFDVGLGIGTPGIGNDDIQSVTNIVVNGAIRASDFTAFGVRLTSVGDVGGSRADSSKLITRQPDGPGTETPEPSTGMLFGAALVALGLMRR